MLEGQGYQRLVNMHGGMHGHHPRDGSPPEPGWMACGHSTTLQPEPERTWSAIEGGADAPA